MKIYVCWVNGWVAWYIYKTFVDKILSPKHKKFTTLKNKISTTPVLTEQCSSFPNVNINDSWLATVGLWKLALCDNLTGPQDAHMWSSLLLDASKVRNSGFYPISQKLTAWLPELWHQLILSSGSKESVVWVLRTWALQWELAPPLRWLRSSF